MNGKGKCLCGAVTFEAENVEDGVHVCHCSMCRRWAGGPLFSVGAGKVRFHGEENIERYRSSAWAERGFCKRCGSNLFYWFEEAGQYIMNMGSFDDQHAFKIEGEIYIEDKPPGYQLAGNHPRLTGEQFLATLKKN